MSHHIYVRITDDLSLINPFLGSCTLLADVTRTPQGEGYTLVPMTAVVENDPTGKPDGY